MPKRFRLAAFSVTVLLGAAGCAATPASGQPAPPGRLVLGAPLSLSGPLAADGRLSREGYEVCAEVVNGRGGVPVGDRRLPLEIRYADDRSSPEAAVRLVERWNDAGVGLVLGSYGAAITEATAAVVERNGQVLVDGADSADTVFRKGYRRVFAVVAPADRYLLGLIEALDQLADPRPRSLALVTADDGLSQSAARSGAVRAEALGMRVVARESVPAGSGDLSGTLTKIKSARPDVIVVAARRAEAVALVRQAAELGATPSGGIAATITPQHPEFVAALGDAAEGVLGATQWTARTRGADRWFGSAEEYAAAFSARHQGRAPVARNAQATAACLALVLAVERAGTVEADRVRDHLAALDVSTFFGRIRFNDLGQNVTKGIAVVQVHDGRPRQVWPVEGAEAPLRWPAVAARR